MIFMSHMDTHGLRDFYAKLQHAQTCTDITALSHQLRPSG